MISSEVQRTLVKSPPELWSELSDPRRSPATSGRWARSSITRTEPEQLVEWEARGVKGKVEISPSGWGTRVRLSVARELGVEPLAPAAEEPAASVGGHPLDALLAEGRPEALRPPAEAPATETAEETGEAQEPPSEEEPAASAIETDAVLETAAPVEQAAHSEPTPAPATEAARRVASLLERSAQDAAPDGARPASAHLQALWQPREPEPAPASEQETPPEPPEPAPAVSRAEAPAEARPGFFARLFAGFRRRGPAEDAPARPAERDAVPQADLDLPAGTEQVAADTPAAEAEPRAVGEPPHGAEAGPAADTEPSAVAESPGAAEAGPMADTEPGAPTESPAAPSADPAAEPRVQSEPETGAVPEAGEADEPAWGPAGIAAELRAAEEVAAEEVRAVLTEVLDRLGAAHHRPFSRA